MHETNALSALGLELADATETSVRNAVSLSGRELSALVLVRNREGCTVNWLHARLGLTQSGAVRLLDRLELLGLIARARHPGRREVALVVTEHGEKTVDRGTSARAEAIEARLAGLNPAERETFLALAARAVAGVARSRDQGDEACRLCDWRACTPDCPMDPSVTASDLNGPDER